MAEGGSCAIVVMGVQGIGKSTIGALLAARLEVPFVDGDRLHSERSIALMAAGTPLTDDDREPWLHAVGGTLADRAATGVVVACSALRRAYRDIIRAHAPDVLFIEPWAPIELVRERVAARDHEYMPAGLLQSQYDTLEPLGDDERGLRIAATATPEQATADIMTSIVGTGERA